MVGVVLLITNLASSQGVCNHWTLDSRKSQRLALVFHQVCHLWACFGLDWYRFWYCPRNSVNYVSFILFLCIDQWEKYNVWAKFSWVMHECDFSSHNLRETWNQRTTIFPIFHDFKLKMFHFQPDFLWNCWNYLNWVSIRIHDIALEWNVIGWNAENSF